MESEGYFLMVNKLLLLAKNLCVVAPKYGSIAPRAADLEIVYWTPTS